MEKQFVTYEIALALKKLKFNDPCIAKYCRYNSTDDIKLFPQSQNFFKGDGFEYCRNNEYKKEEKTAAPLYQQTIEWFRKKHKIDIFVNPIETMLFSKRTYQSRILTKTSIIICGAYDVYEKAREQAILKSIELIKEK